MILWVVQDSSDTYIVDTEEEAQARAKAEVENG